MKINGKDISQYNARQWRIEFGQSDIRNESEWVRGSPLPYFDRNYRGFKEISISILVYGDSRENIRNKISNIMAWLLETAVLELDGYVRRFKGILTKSNVKEGSDQARKRYQLLELQFYAYEYGDEVIITAEETAEISVYNPGNVVSPAIIEITPLLGLAELTVTGICQEYNGENQPVKIPELSKDKTIILDGVEGLITEDSDIKEVDIWALPAVAPGVNNIKISSNRVYVKIRVLPIYM